MPKNCMILLLYILCIYFRLSARTANSSDIIPQVRVLKHAISKMAVDPGFTGLGSTIAAISRSLDSRFGKYEEDENLIAATFLDPRYKNSLFQNSEEGDLTNINSITAFLTNTLINIQKNKKDHEDTTSSASTDEELVTELDSQGINLDPKPSSTTYDFNSCFEDLMSSNQSNIISSSSKKKIKSVSNSKICEATLKNEIEKFCAVGVMPRDIDALIWWRENRTGFPELEKLANKMLCSPPSSVESERLFSIGGNVYTSHRSRLTPETGERLMFLNFNLRMFNFNY